MSYRDELQRLKLYGKQVEQKKRYTIPKKSQKKIAAEAAEKEARGDNDTDLQRFYKSAVKHMTGYCAETGLRTETKIFQYAIMSICHILPKSTCKSAATHPCNWIELNVDFHKKFDAMSWEEREKMGCWEVIRDKLVMIFPSLDESEMRHFPESVKKFIHDNQPF